MTWIKLYLLLSYTFMLGMYVNEREKTLNTKIAVLFAPITIIAVIYFEIREN